MRVRDPAKSVAFYEKWFDMVLIQRKVHSDFTLYFMISPPEGHEPPAPGTAEAEAYLKAGEYGCCLELTHNHGTEVDDGFAGYHSGNTEPRGFGWVGPARRSAGGVG